MGGGGWLILHSAASVSELKCGERSIQQWNGKVYRGSIPFPENSTEMT